MNRVHLSLLLAALLLLTSGKPASGQSGTPKPAPDVLIFMNGDQLTGKLERVIGGQVVFKSDMAGELTLGFDKIKELRSGSGASQFALLRKGVPIRNMKHEPEGTIAYENGAITVAPSDAPPVTVKPADVAYIIDGPTFDKSVAHRAGPLDGWNGTVTGGATVVRSSSNGTTLTAGVALTRAIPTVPYLPARNRTTLNATESYGTLTTVVPPPPVAVKTSIFHADGERDEYFNPRLYALADMSLDHNYSQGLQLQQVYGIGAGATVLKSARQEFDVKGEVHYERQDYFVLPATPPNPLTPSITLFGSTIGESYRCNLPRKIIFTEFGTYLPAWTQLSDYSANITGSFVMPVFKRLSATISTTDNYLHDPAAGALRNSFQFVTGVAYSIR